MRHQPADAQIGGEDAGDVVPRAVAVGGRRDLAIRRAVAEGDEVLVVQSRQRRVVAEVVAIAMCHRRAEHRAMLPMRGVRRAGAFHPQVAIHGQEAQPGIPQQRARQQPCLAQDLEAVAHAQHMPALGGEIRHFAHDRRLRGHRAAAQVVAIAEPARQHDQVGASRQRGFAVEQHHGLAPRRMFQRDRHVALAVRARKDDDDGLHGITPPKHSAIAARRRRAA